MCQTHGAGGWWIALFFASENMPESLPSQNQGVQRECTQVFSVWMQDRQSVQMVPAEPPSSAAAPLQETTQALPSLSAPVWMGQFAIPAQEFSDGRVGAKSMNIAHLQVSNCPCICMTRHSRPPGPQPLSSHHHPMILAWMQACSETHCVTC